MTGWSWDQVAARVANDLPSHACVNLGIGLPTLVPKFLENANGVTLHSENGIAGLRALADGEEPDRDVVDAGKRPVGLVRGAAILDHEASFALIRGGRLDVAVLGAYEVSEAGDLASWVLQDDGVGSVGGAMDIAVGAKRVIVMMRHVDREGRAKLVSTCRYPLTAAHCVSRVYTEMATLDVTSNGFRVCELGPGVTLDQVQRFTEALLRT